MQSELNRPAMLAAVHGSVRFRDGRTGTVEQVSQHGMLWIRDGKGNLSSADPKTGWSGDGNWRNDIAPNSRI